METLWTLVLSFTLSPSVFMSYFALACSWSLISTSHCTTCQGGKKITKKWEMEITGLWISSRTAGHKKKKMLLGRKWSKVGAGGHNCQRTMLKRPLKMPFWATLIGCPPTRHTIPLVGPGLKALRMLRGCLFSDAGDSLHGKITS